MKVDKEFHKITRKQQSGIVFPQTKEILRHKQVWV